MGCPCGQSNDVRVKNSIGHVSTNHYRDFQCLYFNVFLDKFAVYGQRLEDMTQLHLCLDRCRQARLSLNLAKCAFLVTICNLLGHIVSQEGITMDCDKVQAITKAPAPFTVTALSRFLGQIRWHSRMLRHLADFATPLHAKVHRLPFQWYSIEDEAYQSLKLMLSHAPVVQPQA